MGNKPSLPGRDSTARSPRTDDILTAYKKRDLSRARDLVREACDESSSQLEKVGDTTAVLDWTRAIAPILSYQKNLNKDFHCLLEMPHFANKLVGVTLTS
jgi:hypothetical protein